MPSCRPGRSDLQRMLSRLLTRAHQLNGPLGQNRQLHARPPQWWPQHTSPAGEGERARSRGPLSSACICNLQKKIGVASLESPTAEISARRDLPGPPAAQPRRARWVRVHVRGNLNRLAGPLPMSVPGRRIRIRPQYPPCATSVLDGTRTRTRWAKVREVLLVGPSSAMAIYARIQCQYLI